LWKSKTIQKAQVSEFGIDCSSMCFGFREVGKLHKLTSYTQQTWPFLWVGISGKC
jgi:hypothetical protein